MIRNYLPLVDAIIEAFFFLECSGDDEVDPDSAVRCMENMSAGLLKLDRADQLALRSHLVSISDDADDAGYARFVRALPEMLGLASA